MTAINLKTLGRSSLTSGLAQLWRIASRLVITPLIIGAIGLEGLGVWSLVFSLSAYVGMTNTSFGQAYTKFTAECVRQRRYDDLAHIIGSGMTGVGSIGLIGLAIAWLFGEPIMAWLEVPAAMVPDAALALTLVLAVLVLRMTVGCSLEILAGLQRIDLTYRLNALSYLVEFVIQVPLLLMGYGLIGLAIGHVIGQASIHFAAYSMVRQRLPQVRISPLQVSREGMRQVLSVGGRFQLLWAVNTIVVQGLKILISKLVGVDYVAIYDLADKLISLGKTASEAVVAPLMPAFASLRAGGERLRERLLFLKGSKADALMGGTSFAFLALFAPELLLLWTGEDIPQAAWALRVLAIGEASLLLTSVVSSSLRAQGRVRLEFTWAMVTTGVIVVLVIPLAPTMGFEGMIYARLVGQLVGTVWYLRAYFSFAGMSWGEYLRGTRIPRLAVLLAASGALVLVLRSTLPPLPLPETSPRLAAMLEVMIWSVPYLVLWGVSVWRSYLTAEDREQVCRFSSNVWDSLRRRGATDDEAPAAPESVDVLVVMDAGADAGAPLVEAARALGEVRALSVEGSAQWLQTGPSVRVVLVQLGPQSEPHDTWSWLEAHRPDLRTRVGYVRTADDPRAGDPPADLGSVDAVRWYAATPTAETLRADWGIAPETDASPEAGAAPPPHDAESSDPTSDA